VEKPDLSLFSELSLPVTSMPVFAKLIAFGTVTKLLDSVQCTSTLKSNQSGSAHTED